MLGIAWRSQILQISRPNDDCRAFVHGDDFCALGDEEDVDNLEKVYMSHYEMKRVGMLGLGEHCAHEV